MAIVAGDFVIPSVFGILWPTPVLIGVVESAGPPAVVNWSNGLRTSYADGGAEGLLNLDVASANVLAAYHKKVRLLNPFVTPGAPNGLITSEGMVVNGVTTKDTATDFLLVKWTNGDTSWVAYAAVDILDTSI